MKIIHVTKHPYARATRTLMQSRWCGESIILTPQPESSDNYFASKKLSFWGVANSITPETQAIIFHEQGTLNYLIFINIFLWIFGKNKVKIVYDIHDIYKYPISLKEKLKKPQELVKELIEWYVFKNKRIKIITVSKGLSIYLKTKYGRKPDVVRSISEISVENPKEHRENLVYFGAGLAIFPFQVIPALNNQLHLDYYDFKNNLTHHGMNYIRYLGGYKSSHLSFLSNYLALVVSLNKTYGDVDAYNLRYSLPNKFFQSLSKCLPVIAHGDFIEAAEYFKDIEGFFYAWNGQPDDLLNIVEKIKVRNFGNCENDIKMIDDFLKNSEKNSKKIYMRSVEK